MNETLFGAEQEPFRYSQEIAGMLRRDWGEELGFDEQTLQEIAAMPFEEAFQAAYGYLAQAGVDNPDEVLARWTE